MKSADATEPLTLHTVMLTLLMRIEQRVNQLEEIGEIDRVKATELREALGQIKESLTAS